MEMTSSSRGPVVVPDELRQTVWTALVAEYRRRQALDGGSPMSPAVQRFLWDLRQGPSDSEGPTSARGSEPDEPANVMTTADVAQRIGCSTRWARTVIQSAGGTKTGRDWVIREDHLVHYMTEGRP